MKLIEKYDHVGGGRRRRTPRSVLVGYITRAISIRTDYKGNTYKAGDRKNGMTRVKKRVFN